MANYLLTEVDVSSEKEFQDDEIIDPITHVDLDFINNGDSDVDDADFYCSTNKKLVLSEENKTLLLVLKFNVRKSILRAKVNMKRKRNSSQFQILSTLNFLKKQKLSYPKECVLFMVLITMNGIITCYQRESSRILES